MCDICESTQSDAVLDVLNKCHSSKLFFFVRPVYVGYCKQRSPLHGFCLLDPQNGVFCLAVRLCPECLVDLGVSWHCEHHQQAVQSASYEIADEWLLVHCLHLCWCCTRCNCSQLQLLAAKRIIFATTSMTCDRSCNLYIIGQHGQPLPFLLCSPLLPLASGYPLPAWFHWFSDGVVWFEYWHCGRY